MLIQGVLVICFSVLLKVCEGIFEDAAFQRFGDSF